MTAGAASKLPEHRPTFLELWAMTSATPFLWLWRHKWLGIPVACLEIAGLGLVAYGAIVGTDIIWPLGYEAGDWQFPLAFFALSIAPCVLIPAILFPIIRFGGSALIFGGVGIGLFDIYSWLRFGVWPHHSVYGVLGSLYDLSWLDDHKDWVGAKIIIGAVLRWTPISLVMLLFGVKLSNDASRPETWDHAIKAYRKLVVRHKGPA